MSSCCPGWRSSRSSSPSTWWATPCATSLTHGRIPGRRGLASPGHPLARRAKLKGDVGQDFRRRGLDEKVIESGLRGTRAVLFSPVAGEGDQHGLVELDALA